MTPEDLLNSQVEEFNKGNISFLMTLYEKDAGFASKPGQVVKDMESIRQSFQGFINMGVKLDARAKRVLQAGNLMQAKLHGMLHLQTSNQSPVTLQFGISALVEAVAVAVVTAAICLYNTSDILAFHVFFDIPQCRFG